MTHEEAFDLAVRVSQELGYLGWRGVAMCVGGEWFAEGIKLVNQNHTAVVRFYNFPQFRMVKTLLKV